MRGTATLRYGTMAGLVMLLPLIDSKIIPTALPPCEDCTLGSLSTGLYQSTVALPTATVASIPSSDSTISSAVGPLTSPTSISPPPTNGNVVVTQTTWSWPTTSTSSSDSTTSSAVPTCTSLITSYVWQTLSPGTVTVTMTTTLTPANMGIQSSSIETVTSLETTVKSTSSSDSMIPSAIPTCISLITSYAPAPWTQITTTVTSTVTPAAEVIQSTIQETVGVDPTNSIPSAMDGNSIALTILGPAYYPSFPPISATSASSSPTDRTISTLTTRTATVSSARPAASSPPNAILTVGGITLTENSASQFPIAPGVTLAPGGPPIVIFGTVYSLGASNIVVVNGATQTLAPAPEPTAAPCSETIVYTRTLVTGSRTLLQLETTVVPLSATPSARALVYTTTVVTGSRTLVEVLTSQVAPTALPEAVYTRTVVVGSQTRVLVETAPLGSAAPTATKGAASAVQIPVLGAVLGVVVVLMAVFGGVVC